MPECGSQVTLCDVPIRIDTYKGCSHHCKYCFVYRKYDISNIGLGESVQSVVNFIQGKRTKETNWCDWNIPLHWGGCSDPFQPCEKIHKRSLAVLEALAKTKYPFIVSTKAVLPLSEPYFSLFKQCNCVFQCSMVCPSLAKVEQGAPDFEARLNMMREMSKIVPRTIVRCQPYVVEFHKEIMAQIPRIAEAGVYGIVFEAIKMQKKIAGMVKNGADYVYPIDALKRKFKELKEECHKYGLVFLSGENRLRGMGDSLTCCGCEGLEGFEVNHYNLNYFIHAPERLKSTPAMDKKDTCTCFKAMKMDSTATSVFRKTSFKEMMNTKFKDRNAVKDYMGE